MIISVNSPAPIKNNSDALFTRISAPFLILPPNTAKNAQYDPTKQSRYISIYSTDSLSNAMISTAELPYIPIMGLLPKLTNVKSSVAH